MGTLVPDTLGSFCKFDFTHNLMEMRKNELLDVHGIFPDMYVNHHFVLSQTLKP